MKRFTREEFVELVLSSNSQRIGTFDKRKGYNYTDDEVICLSEDGGGMRGCSFCDLKNYEDGELTHHSELPSREDIMQKTLSYSYGHGAKVYIQNGKERELIGKLSTK